MNRRSLLKGLLVAPVATAAALISKPEPEPVNEVTLHTFRELETLRASQLNGNTEELARRIEALRWELLG